MLVVVSRTSFVNPIRIAASAGALCVALTSSGAHAETIIRDPNPPKYHLELEPKLNLNYFLFTYYGGEAWGPGVRASIPLVSPGFIKTLNNSVAISFGVDFMHYNGTG